MKVNLKQLNLHPKILFLLHLPPPVQGSSTVGINIKNSVFINKAFECYYINLVASKDVAEEGKINFRKIFDFLRTFIRVFLSLVKNRPQLCYLALTSTGSAFYRDLLLVALLRLFHVKRVYHMHNKGVSLHQGKTINQICYRYLFNHAEVIILSKYLYFDIKNFVPESKVHVCHNGISHQGNKEYKFEGLNNSEGSIVRILFLSNLIESKGIFILLEALALLKQKKINFKCVFIGGEKDVTVSILEERKNKLGLNSHIFYLGKKYGKEKELAFLEADILALPTYYSNECFPLTLLEAMSYSLPIVSTFEGGIPDIVEDTVTGFLVKQKSVKPLADKLELLIKDSNLRQQMGIAGRKKYEQAFTLEKFEHKLVEILQQVIKNG